MQAIRQLGNQTGRHTAAYIYQTLGQGQTDTQARGHTYRQTYKHAETWAVRQAHGKADRGAVINAGATQADTHTYMHPSIHTYIHTRVHTYMNIPT